MRRKLQNLFRAPLKFPGILTDVKSSMNPRFHVTASYFFSFLILLKFKKFSVIHGLKKFIYYPEA